MDADHYTERAAECTARRDRLAAELATITERITAAPDDPGLAERARNLQRGITLLDAEIAEHHHTADRYRHLERLAANPSAHEDGVNVRTMPIPGRATTGGRATHHIPGGTVDTSPITTAAIEARDAALRAIDGHRDTLTPAAADRLDAIVRGDDVRSLNARYLAAVADPAYLRAWCEIVADASGAHLRMSAEEQAAVHTVREIEAVRALAEGTLAAGGYAIPFTLDPSVILTSAGASNPVRRLARVVTIGSREWHGVSSDGVTASFSAELAEVADGTPTLAGPIIRAEKAHAFVPYSIEVGEDWGTLQSEMARLFADAKDNLEATKMLTGAGSASNEPQGVLTGLGTAQRVYTAGTATLAVGDPYLLREALPARFMGRAAFAAHPTTLDRIYRFVGGGSTEPPVMATRDGGILGTQTEEWSAMDSATTSGQKVLVYGDFQTGYVIADRVGGQVELIPHLMGDNQRPIGARGMYYYWRVGAGVVAPQAFRYMEVR